MSSIVTQSVRNQVIRETASTFPYHKYADLMTQISVDEIRPGELCTIHFHNFKIPQNVTDLHDALLKKGYRVNVIVRPIDVEKIIWQNATPKIKEEYKAHHRWLGREYDHILWLRGDTGVKPRPIDRWFDFAEYAFPKINALLKRDAKEGESVQIYATTDDSSKLVEEIVRRILDKKGIPFVMGMNAELNHHLYINAQRDDQLSFVRADNLFLYQTTQRHFDIRSTTDNTFAKVEIPPDSLGKEEYDRRKALHLEPRGTATKLYMDRMARAELGPRPPDKLLRTLGLDPSLDLAEEFGFPRTQEGLNQFGEFYSRITHMDEADPIAFYRHMIPLVDHYAKQLRTFHTFNIKTDNGKTNVTLSIRDKGEKESRYVAASTVTGNALPAEVFTSPVEDSVNGTIYFDLPFALDNKVFKGVTLTFKDGKVIDVKVDEGDLDHLRGMILGVGPKADLKVKNFDVLGEFAIGFNRKITKLMEGKVVTNTLVAEKQDLHFALGNSYSNTGGKNKCNLHKDMPVFSGAGSGLTISGLHDKSSEPMIIYREGNFTEEFLDFDSDFNWRQYYDIKWD